MLTKLERAIHTTFERLTAIASPQAAIERIRARKMFEFAYDAANPGRSRGSANISTSKASENLRNQADRVRMMWEVRDLSHNYSFIKSVLLKEAMYVCGSIRYQANTGDPVVDSIIEDYWDFWTKHCDITGRHGFRHLIQLGHMSMRRDGDFGFILVNQDDIIKLQAIEADRIGNPNMNGNEEDYFGGVKVDDLGSVQYYRIFERTIHGQYRNPVEITPDAFVHYFDPMRTDQYRGVTAFDTVIPHARDLYELLQMEKMAVKWGSSHAGVVTKTDPKLPDWGDTGNGDTSNGTRKEKIEPGTILRLQPGENVSMFPTMTRPSPTFNGFIEAIIREMANGLILPFSFVWDMAALGGAGARIELAMAARTFERSQQMLVEQVLNPIRDAVLNRAAAFGYVPPHQNLTKGEWQFPGTITADEGYQTQADMALLQQGLKTRTQIFAENGKDFEEQTRTLAREVQIYQQVAGETGVPIELLTQGLPMATQMLAMMQMSQQATESGQEAPGNEPPPEEGGGESEGGSSGEAE